MKMIVCHSVDIDTKNAVKENLIQAKKILGSEIPKALIIFSDISHDLKVIIDRILKEYPEIEIIGSSSDGEISSPLLFEEDSLVMAFICSERLKFKAIYSSVNDKFSLKEAFDEQLSSFSEIDQKHDKPSLGLLFSDGLKLNGENSLVSVKSYFKNELPIFGALSSDQWEFKETFQICNNKVLKSSLCMLLIYGPLEISWGISTGSNPYGNNVAIVTRSLSNKVLEINGMPAVHYYEKYLGSYNGSFTEYPLAIQEGDSYKLRSPLNFNIEDGSIVFAGNIEEGAIVRLTDSSKNEIIYAAKKAIQSSLEKFNQKNEVPEAAIIFNCAARKSILGTSVKEETSLIKEELNDIPYLGFYSYGEYCPLDNQNITNPLLHNKTFSLLTVKEKEN